MGERAVRRRRDPRDAEREIVDAGAAFLAERPYGELTVDAVMSRTTLSRSSFYVYFRDRPALVNAILDRIGAELFEIDQAWLTGPTGSGRSALRATLDGVAGFFERYGALVQAISDASRTDPEVERHYRDGLLGGFAAAVSDRLARGQAVGEIPPFEDTGAVALALILMTERTLLDAVDRGEGALPAAVAALAQVWERTLYWAG